jgi:transposase-like protein
MYPVVFVVTLPPDVRRMIDAPNALESVHSRVRTFIKTRGRLRRPPRSAGHHNHQDSRALHTHKF